jgi:tetratricopeptide (TPR) repeat protein
VVDLNRVITELNKIVSDHPDVSYVIFLRGFFYVAKTEFKKFEQSDLDQGIADFNRCLELNPDHVTAFLYRGFLFFKMAGLATDPETKEEHYQTAMDDYTYALELDPVSGISHYLQALLWSVRSADEHRTEEEATEMRATAIAELRESFECQFKGYERIKSEPGFDAIREDPEFVELMRGK